MNRELKTVAERSLRSLYGGDPAVVDELASEDIIRGAITTGQQNGPGPSHVCYGVQH